VRGSPIIKQMKAVRVGGGGCFKSERAGKEETAGGEETKRSVL
jgi:hypothetical protein